MMSFCNLTTHYSPLLSKMQTVKKMSRSILAAAQSPDPPLPHHLRIVILFFFIIICHGPSAFLYNLGQQLVNFNSPTSSTNHAKHQSQYCFTKTLECSSSYNARASGQSEVSTKPCMTCVWQKKQSKGSICSGSTPLHINFELSTGVSSKIQQASAT